METFSKNMHELNFGELNYVSGASGDIPPNEGVTIGVGWKEYVFDRAVNDWVMMKDNFPYSFEFEQ